MPAPEGRTPLDVRLLGELELRIGDRSLPRLDSARHTRAKGAPKPDGAPAARRRPVRFRYGSAAL